MTVIYKKELRRLLGSLRGLTAMATVLLVSGIYACFYNLLMGHADFSYTLIGSFLAMIVALPLLCSDLFVRDRRAGAQRMWYSLSFTPRDVLLGKFFAALTVFLMASAVLALYPLLFSIFGEIVLVSAYFAWLGYVLLGTALLSLCLLISLFGKSAWIPFGVGVGTVLLLWLIQRFLPVIPTSATFSFITVLVAIGGVAAFLWFVVGSRPAACGTSVLLLAAALLFVLDGGAYTALVPRVLAFVNPFSRFSGFIYGRFDLEGILFYLSFTVFFLIVSVLLLRYRRDDER